MISSQPGSLKPRMPQLCGVALVFVIWMQGCSIYAQVISGFVKAETGEALAGVNVIVKGTNWGVVTDLDGNFTLEDIVAEHILQFSYVGYTTQEIKVGNQSRLDIVMKPDATILDKVVVVGYGTQKKINLTGAVAVADGEVFKDRPIANVAEGLKGVIPNLNINIPNGDPADNGIDINIRGYESINGGQPLILVDGVPMDLNRLNPNDIESISVLKDAAASAIYGGRAAFGVILVQTKQGSKEKISINATNEFALAKPIFFIDPISDPHQFVLARNQAFNRKNVSDEYDSDYIENTEKWVEDPTEENAWGVYKGEFRFYGNNNYANELLTDYAPQQRYNFDVSGTSKAASYYVSFSYLNKDGYLRNNDWNLKFKRYNILMKGAFSINDWMDLDSRILTAIEKSDKPHSYFTSGLYTIPVTTPLDPIIFPDLPYYLEPGDREEYEPYIGMYIEGKSFPYLAGGARDTWTRSNIILTQGATLNPLPGLNIRGELSYDLKHFISEEVQSRVTMINSDLDLRADNLLTPGFSENDWIRNAILNDQYFVINAYSDYTMDNNKSHYFKAMIGFNQEWGVYQSIVADAYELITPYVTDLNATVGRQENSGGQAHVALRGYFYRLNYIFKDRYLLEANGRYDGTSRFPRKDRWAFFPSFSAGWRISNESFMSGTSGWLNNLMLRTSYGELGNQLLTDSGNNQNYYPSIPSMAMGLSPYMFSQGQPSPYVAASGLVSPTLTWESVNTWNVGFDITLFRNRLDFSFDMYTRNTLNMLMNVTQPSILGAEAPQTNAADLQTRGWEVAASWRNTVNQNWSYGLTLALSDNVTEITRYDNPTGSLDEYYVGHVIGERWGFETVGIFQNQEQITDAADQNGIAGGSYTSWRPGDIQYADLNEDGVISMGENTLDSSGDQKIIAYETPRYNFGITAKLRYKNLSLNLFFQGTLKYDYWPPYFANQAFYPYSSSFVQGYYLTDTWSEDNRKAYFAAPDVAGSHNYLPQTRYVQDASYIRLKNLTLAYSLPPALASKIALEGLQVYFSGENLWEHTNLRKPLEPEPRSEMNQEYYKQRIYSLGIKVSL